MASNFSYGGSSSGSGDEKMKAEMEAFIEQENQKAAIQAVIQKLTETCWEKCIGKPGSRLSGSEHDCLANCAERFLDTSMLVMQRLMKRN